MIFHGFYFFSTVDLNVVFRNRKMFQAAVKQFPSYKDQLLWQFSSWAQDINVNDFSYDTSELQWTRLGVLTTRFNALFNHRENALDKDKKYNNDPGSLQQTFIDDDEEKTGRHSAKTQKSK